MMKQWSMGGGCGGRVKAPKPHPSIWARDPQLCGFLWIWTSSKQWGTSTKPTSKWGPESGINNYRQLCWPDLHLAFLSSQIPQEQMHLGEDKRGVPCTDTAHMLLPWWPASQMNRAANMKKKKCCIKPACTHTPTFVQQHLDTKDDYEHFQHFEFFTRQTFGPRYHYHHGIRRHKAQIQVFAKTATSTHTLTDICSTMYQAMLPW